MTLTTKATYDGGVFRPVSPLPLRDGQTVELTVTESPATAAGKASADNISDWLNEIAAIPSDKPEPADGLSGSRDHDKILYGARKDAK